MRRLTFVALFALLAPLLVQVHVQAQTPVWTRQISSSGYDRAYEVVTDELGDVYICGASSGWFDPSRSTPTGQYDVLVVKVSSLGTVKWIRQFGTSLYVDRANGIALDQAGNIYVCGETKGTLGATSHGEEDAFVSKFDGLGKLLWTRQFGTSGDDVANDIAVDGLGNAYVVGSSQLGFGGVSSGSLDAFVAKFDTDGTMLWARQIATHEEERGNGVAVDAAGNAYVGGSTWGDLAASNKGEADAFLAKFDGTGEMEWIRQFGGKYKEYAVDVGLSATGVVYLGGSTLSITSSYSGSPRFTFLAKYDGEGNLNWGTQSRSIFDERFQGLAVDPVGNVYAGGYTQYWGHEVALSMFGTNGSVRWATTFGSTESDSGSGVAVDPMGSVYITGWTRGSMGGPANGDDDIFLAKFSEVSCYADCDTSTGVGVLDVFDYLCFQNAFINEEAFACDCDAVRASGVCDIWDYICFSYAFVAGCP